MSPEDWTAADHALDALKKTISSAVENDFREITDEYQPTLYHYTDVKGALGILQTGHLWFTERAHLNDPVEIQYGLEVAYQMFETSAKNRDATIPTEAASHLKGEHAFRLSTNGFWIFSFSLDDNNLSQWQNYADDGRGVCLGFSTDNLDMQELVKPVGPVASTWLRFPVSYNETHLRQRLQK
jgi:hypothetical protein